MNDTLIQHTDTDSRQSPVGSDDAADLLGIKRSIRAHSERLKQQELQQAVTQLEADETLTSEQRRIVDEMATAILDQILSSPEAVLTNCEEHDPETVRTAVDLFDPDG